MILSEIALLNQSEQNPGIQELDSAQLRAVLPSNPLD